MRQVLAWAMEHDPAIALRLAVALGWWWMLRGRLPGQYRLLREAAGRAEPGSDSWCAAQMLARPGRGVLRRIWPGRWSISPRCATRPRAGGRPGRWLTAWPAGRSRWITWAGSPRRPRRPAASLAVAREIGYPAGEILALGASASPPGLATTLIDAVQLARQAAQITAGVPGCASGGAAMS